METWRKFIYALFFLPPILYVIGFKKVIHRNKTAIFVLVVVSSLIIYFKFYKGSVEEQIDAMYK